MVKKFFAGNLIGLLLLGISPALAAETSLELEIDHAYSLERNANGFLSRLADAADERLAQKIEYTVELLEKAASAHQTLAEKLEVAIQSELDEEKRFDYKNQFNIHMENYGILHVKAMKLEVILRHFNSPVQESEVQETSLENGIYEFPNTKAYEEAVVEADESSKSALSMAEGAQTATELNRADLALRRAAAKYLRLAHHHRYRMRYYRVLFLDDVEAQSKVIKHSQLKDEFTEKHDNLNDKARSIRPENMLESDLPKTSTLLH